MAKKLIAFKGKPALKAQKIAELQEHRRQDNIVQGTGWKNGCGCAVGCTLKDYNHKAYETELGIPVHLAGVEDGIFEGLPDGAYQTFPEAFLKAIPVGADLRLVHFLFALWILTDPKYGILRHTGTGSDEYKAVTHVASLVQRKIDGRIVQKRTWQKALDVVRALFYKSIDITCSSLLWTTLSIVDAILLDNDDMRESIDAAAEAHGDNHDWSKAARDHLLALLTMAPLHKHYKLAA